MTDSTKPDSKEAMKSYQITPLAKRIAKMLPPDILMHPMPFPDRLDYAEKIIQEYISPLQNELTAIENECLGWNRPQDMHQHVGTQTQYGRVAAMKDELNKARDQLKSEKEVTLLIGRQAEKMREALIWICATAIARGPRSKIAERAREALE